MSPKAQGLLSNTHHCKKHMLKTCTHDRMIGGKAAKRSNSGATAKKTTFLVETNHAAVSLTPKEDDSSWWVSTLGPKCHTTVVTPTKMECSAMIIINKGPNKGLLFEPNTGSNLGHPVGFLFCPEFLPPQIHPTTMAGLQIQPHDGSITQWVFSFLPL